MKKPPLVLIHGFRGAPLGLAEIAEHLERAGYPVFVPPIPPTGTPTSASAAGTHLPGTPTSASAAGTHLPSAPFAYTPTAYADYLADFIRQNHLDRPILIGHSMGSIIAAATAHYHPDLIASHIIFLAPIATHPPRFLAPLVPLSSLLPNRLISHLTTRYLFVTREQADTTRRQHTYSTRRRASAATRALYRKCLSLTIQSGAASSGRSVRLAAAFSCRYGISNFTFGSTPTFIVGEKDRLANFSDLRALTASHPGAELITLKNCGHIFNYERPAAVADAILTTLNNKKR